jgi:hypothetical protein
MLRYVEILVEGTKVLIRTKAHDHGVPFLGGCPASVFIHS